MKGAFMIALLLLASCAAQRVDPDLREDIHAGRISTTQAFNTQQARNAGQLFNAAEKASGYSQCVFDKAADTVYGGPETEDIAAVTDWIVTSAENVCSVQWGKFITEARTVAPAHHFDPSQLPEAGTKATLHREFVKAMLYSIGASDEKSKVFPPPQ